MDDFNYELLDRKIGDTYSTNSIAAIAFQNAGIKVKEDAIKKWRQSNSVPKTKDLNKLCKLLKIDASDLLLTKDTEKEVAINNYEYSLLSSYNVMAGAAADGYLPDVLESTKVPIANKFLNGANADYLHIIQVAGDSMQPTINPNDWLIIDMVSNGNSSRNFEKVDGIYLISRDGSIQIKRLAFRGTKGVDIISDNPMYPIDNTLEKGIELVVLGKLFKHIKDLGMLTIKEII